MSHLHEGFVYLETIDSSILQEVVYAGDGNCMGRPIEGYEAARCIVSVAAGEALAKAQEEAKKHELMLKVYDAYRPLRAVESFLCWIQDLEDTVTKAEYYPDLEKEQILSLGYVKIRSFHSRGAAVDVTLVPLASVEQGKASDSLDMGTRFDFFGDLSHTKNPNISEEVRKNRTLLCAIMEKNGFVNYDKEWWHFNLKEEPFPDTFFDFVVRAC